MQTLRDDREWPNRGGVYARIRGPVEPGLVEISVPDYRFLPLVNYRRYRLERHSGRENRLPRHHRLLKHWENFQSEIGEAFTFDGEDPALIVHFLYSMVDLLDQRGYNEAVAFNFLPRMLKGNAKLDYDAARSASSTSERPVNNWPSAVNYLLQVYAQYPCLKEAEEELRQLKQSRGEDESRFFQRFEQAHLRTGSILDSREKLTAFVNGLDEAIKEPILVLIQERPDISMLDVVRRARSEGKLWRSRSALMGKYSSPPVNKKTIRTVNSVDVNVLGDFAQPPCPASTTDTGSGHQDWQEETVNAVQHIPGIGYRQPGWQVSDPRAQRRRFSPLTDVCERCYLKGQDRQLSHPANNCPASVPRDSAEIVANFAKLALWEKAKVSSSFIMIDAHLKHLVMKCDC